MIKELFINLGLKEKMKKQVQVIKIEIIRHGRLLIRAPYIKSFFRFVSPSALDDPKGPDQGFIISGCSGGNLHAGALPSGPTWIYPRTEKKIKNRKNFFSPCVSSYSTPVQINFLTKEPLPAEAARGSFFLIPFCSS